MNEYPSMYLAGAWDRRVELRRYAYTLRYMGVNVTSRWLSEDHQKSGTEPTKEDLTRAAIEDIEDIVRAKYFVRWSDPQYFTKNKSVPRNLLSASRMVETGIALSLGKTVYVIGGVQSVFDNLPSVAHVKDFPAFVRMLNLFKES